MQVDVGNYVRKGVLRPQGDHGDKEDGEGISFAGKGETTARAETERGEDMHAGEYVD